MPRLHKRVAACGPGDDLEMLAIGSSLWPQAAAVLRASVVPFDWSSASGLTAADFGAIARGLSALLAPASDVLRCRGRPRPGGACRTRRWSTS